MENHKYIEWSVEDITGDFVNENQVIQPFSQAGAQSQFSDTCKFCGLGRNQCERDAALPLEQAVKTFLEEEERKNK